MKSYKEMSDSVIKRVNEHKEKRKKRKKNIKNVTLVTTCIAMVAAVSVGTVMVAEKRKFKTEAEIFGEEYNASIHMEAETLFEKQPDTSKLTTEKTTTSKTTSTEKESDVIGETIMPTASDVETTSKLPIELAEAEKMIYYYDGISGAYPRLYLNSILSDCRIYLLDGWVESVNTSFTQDTIAEIKKSDRAVEFLYDSAQKIEITLFDESKEIITYDSVFFVLSGEKQGLMFFGKDGKYTSYPFRSSREDCISGILSLYKFTLLIFE